MIEIQWVAVTKIVKILDKTFMAHCSAMLCQQVTLSGDAEWPKVADAVIEAAYRVEGTTEGCRRNSAFSRIVA